MICANPIKMTMMKMVPSNLTGWVWGGGSWVRFQDVLHMKHIERSIGRWIEKNSTNEPHGGGQQHETCTLPLP